MQTSTILPTLAIQSSFHFTIKNILAQWNQLQLEKKQCQKRQHVEIVCQDKPREMDEFDRIMEEDLENQLKELERQEEEQYKQMEQTLEEELQQNNDIDSEQMDDFERYCMNLLEQFEEEDEKRKKQFQSKTVQPQYPRQFHNLKQTQKLQEQQQRNNMHLLKTNILLLQVQQNSVALETMKKKQNIQSKLTLHEINPNKTNRMIDLLRRFFKNKKYRMRR